MNEGYGVNRLSDRGVVIHLLAWFVDRREAAAFYESRDVPGRYELVEFHADRVQVLVTRHIV